MKEVWPKKSDNNLCFCDKFCQIYDKIWNYIILNVTNGILIITPFFDSELAQAMTKRSKT